MIGPMRGLPNTLALALALTLPGCDRVFGVDPSVDGGDGDGGVPDAACRDQCGDGCVTAPEQCDDGNTDDHDGCSSICQVEVLTWTSGPPPGLAARSRAGFAYHATSNSLLLIGGLGRTDAWTWDGGAWQLFNLATEDPVGSGPGLAPGPGGRLTYYPDDTDAISQWDGAAWSTPFTLESRSDHAVAEGPAATTVIFGGEIAGRMEVNNETLLVVAGTLSAAPASPSEPGPRRRASLAFAPALGGTILFGGFNDNGAALADTWLFDGVGWTELPVEASAPPARGGAAMAYDPFREQLLLFGGALDRNDADTLNDLWALTPSGWTAVPTSGGPSPRAGASLALHPPTSTFVLFGGVASGIASDETWLLRYE